MIRPRQLNLAAAFLEGWKEDRQKRAGQTTGIPIPRTKSNDQINQSILKNYQKNRVR
jgi:hypothetical protein